MTFLEKLTARTAEVGNLCIGLDPRAENHHNRVSEVEDFLVSLIEETAPYAAAFKPNSAYFESLGSEGFALLERTVARIPKEIPIVLDVKRSDIGETQRRYAVACFEHLRADAVTLNPFMGYDSLEPFLDYPGGKGLYLLALTSNSGSADFQRLEVGGETLYQKVAAFAARAASQNRPSTVGLVLGLTNAGPQVLERVPDIPLLIPGLGAQGGDLASLAASKRQAPNLVNVSRGIIYPGDDRKPAELAREFAEQIRATLQPC
ncbi:orotidine-5'-phosphate decarboxylase [Roseibacillus ishigakijimensis]|uniref:Orotidine-5'-phosphate decarboxylase n=1 Tax=Roseibacillus ishigakijimensis TaxID=454146 RepID=A0A934RQQ5_9BACT|nr:orotidine-5'-phosphate decarboxylase [Roseibacillus ishigakijimensis]MBK1835210.1 orotidine-5'-phosphate decarboxylase [Roseibacillus ishigakijimensis]